MNKKEHQIELRHSITLLKLKLENIKPHIEESERLNNMYNKMLIEKAILKKELDDTTSSNGSWLNRLTRIVRPKNEKLISDYFHG